MSGAPLLADAKDAQGLWWVTVDGEQRAGYASLTRAELYRDGYAAGLAGERFNANPPVPDRPGVHHRRAREAWKEGWLDGRGIRHE